MKEIELTRGLKAKVDDEDFDRLSCFKWYAHREYYNIYARRMIHISVGKQKTALMHQVIMNTPPGMHTDHIDHDGLNNQRANLRVCTCQQNQMNSRMRRNNITGFIGVSYCRQTGKYSAHIGAKYKRKRLGRFTTSEAASAAYQTAAKKLFGEFKLQEVKQVAP